MLNKKPLTYKLAAVGVFGVIGFLIVTSLDVLSFYGKDTKNYRSGLDSLSQVIVAQVGSIDITGKEFLTSYEVGPAFVKRQHRDNPRLAHLDLMIKEKLMALEGYEQEIHKAPDVQVVLSEIKADRAVEEMYKADILSQVRVSDERLEHAAEEAAIQVWFRYVQLENKEQADRISDLIDNGVPFDSLSVPGHNPINQDPLTFWYIKQQDPVLAEKLASLDIGIVSKRIETPRGIFFARVDRVYKDPFMTPVKYAEERRKLEVKMRQLVADSIAFDYAASMLEAARPVIKREAFNDLFSFFEVMGATGGRDVEQVLMGNWPGALDRSGMEEVMPVTLIETEEGEYTVAEFFDWYDLRRFPVEGGTEGARANRLKSIIWRMLRDRLMAKEAEKGGFANHPLVLEEVDWWSEKMAYWEVRERLLSEVEPTEADIQEVVDQYPHRYTDEDPQKNQKQAFRDVYTLQERDVLYAFFAEIEDRYLIKIDSVALEALPIRTDGLSKPIDMVALKKEGTFPRIAYPTIDRVWERL